MFNHVQIHGVTQDSSLEVYPATFRTFNFHCRFCDTFDCTLSRDVAQKVACDNIGLRLDYCNSLHYGMSDTNLPPSTASTA